MVSENPAREMRVPLYHQIYVVIRDQILNGYFPAGSTLPSEREIMVSYKVSRITAKRALDELAHEGMVTRVRGRGTQVTPLYTPPPLQASVSSWLATMDAIRETSTVQIVDFHYAPATLEEADALEIPAGTTIQRSLRVSSVQGVPFSQSQTTVPEHIGRSFSRTDLKRQGLLELIQRFGEKVTGGQQTVSASLADQKKAERLKVEVGSPLLRVKRVVNGSSGRPVQFVVAYYRPDRYQLQMSLPLAELS
ncbi:MAG: GntR family transcriptional regulator [Hyphomicrobiaceae bacterium]